VKKAEIMAPVGSFESLSAAINAGCDSVYFGVEQLNMRARAAHNFTLDELEEVAATCKKAGIKAYVTMNTLLYDHDLQLMKKIIDKAKACEINAAIIQDIAALQYASEVGLPVHASTQLSISNFESVKFYAKFADTIVLAREVDMKMIKQICERVEKEKITGPSGELVKIEIFVHGALCIAQSGRCQMSLLQSNTSAQRGACLQECRKKYKVIDEETGHEMLIENQYILSPKDLCALPFLDKVLDAGVSVLKIEGRGKTPDYVDCVVRVYKEARDSILNGTFDEEKVEAWMKKLESVYNRGFTDGYYLGKKLPEWSKNSGNKSTEERIFAGLVSHYFDKSQIAELDLQAHEITKGDKLLIIGKSSGVVYADVDEMMKDEKLIEKSGKQTKVTLSITQKVRKNDKVYLLKKRSLNVIA
jgi:putative protease